MGIDAAKSKEKVFIMNEKIFPTILIILDIASAVVYATKGDMRKMIYWIAAAVLTFVVTY